MTIKLSAISPSIRYWLLVALVTSVAIWAGRTFPTVDAGEQPPRISELRQAPTFRALAARPVMEPAVLARSVDTIGVVRIAAIEKVKDITQVTEPVGEHSWGRGLVTATVIDVVAGERSRLESFAFTAAFEPNTNEFAISNIDPPLEVGAEYLVFLDDGKVVFPGGNYRVADGRVWNIGHWLSPDSRAYPDDLSGLSVAEATREIRAALATP